MKQAALPILVLLIVVTLAVVAALPSASLEADHYQRFRDGKSLYTLLHGSIGRGDSLQDVENLIGPGVPLVEDTEEFRTSLRETAQWHPELFPDGVLDSDVFLTWPGSDQQVTMQFRNGFLVNHSRSQFADFQPAYDVAGQTGLSDDRGNDTALTIAGQENASTPAGRFVEQTP